MSATSDPTNVTFRLAFTADALGTTSSLICSYATISTYTNDNSLLAIAIYLTRLSLFIQGNWFSTPGLCGTS